MSTMSCPKCNTNISPEMDRCASCGEPLTSIDPLIGRTLIDKYTIRRKLGAGGFGAVYEADHLLLECKVAIKTLHSRAEQNSTMLERFRREALATSRVTHPYAVKIYDRGETRDGLAWLAMELLQGETLAQHLQKRRVLSVGEVLAILGPLCEVLSEAHEKGVVHRDLKPENIMLVPLPKGGFIPKILDFGIAAILNADTLTQAGTVSGSPRYMAPEQWEGLSRADSRSDVYSLGMIAYQCLSGRLPFEADSPLSWMKKHYFETPLDIADAAPTRELPSALSDAVMKAISKKGADRQQSAHELWQSMNESSAQAPKVEAPSQPNTPMLAELTLPSLDDKTVLLPANPDSTPPAVTTLPEGPLRKNRFGAWLLGASLLLASLFLLPSIFSTPPDNTVSPAAFDVLLPVSVPVMATTTSAAASTQASLPAASSPASMSLPSPTTTKANEGLVRCLAMLSTPNEEMMRACALVEGLTKEETTLVEEARAKYKQQRITIATKALAQKDEAGLASAKGEIAKLSKHLSKADAELKRLSKQAQDLDALLHPPKINVPTAEELLQQASNFEASRNINAMCKTLKKYLDLYPSHPDQAKSMKKLAAQDAAANEDCEH